MMAKNSILLASNATNEVPFLGTGIQYAKGIVIKDKEGIRAGRVAGWIFSLPSVWKQMQFQSTALRILLKENLEHTLRKFAVGILQSHLSDDNSVILKTRDVKQGSLKKRHGN